LQNLSQGTKKSKIKIRNPGFLLFALTVFAFSIGFGDEYRQQSGLLSDQHEDALGKSAAPRNNVRSLRRALGGNLTI